MKIAEDLPNEGGLFLLFVSLMHAVPVKYKEIWNSGGLYDVNHIQRNEYRRSAAVY